MQDKSLPLSSLSDFIPMPKNRDEIDFAFACRVLGGDPFTAMSLVVQCARIEIATPQYPASVMEVSHA